MMEKSDARFLKAWKRFCDYYQKSRKDYEYYNSEEMYAESGFHGPHFREERDIVFHLGRFCYDEFGDRWIHLESPIYKMYFEKLSSKKRFVDIEISDPHSFMIENARRGVFVEVKWIWQGIHKARSSWVRDKIVSIEKDLAKLQHLLKEGCCEHAFMCIVDEEPNHTNIEKHNRVVEWEKRYVPVKVLISSYLAT